MSLEAAERYSFQDIDLDVDVGEVRRGGEAVALPPRTFELLVALARRFPHVVRRQELLEAVWPGETVTDQTLSHRVMVLRRALGDHAAEPRYVAGERGWGYRLIGPLERVGASARRFTDATPAPLRGPRAARLAQALGLVALLGLAGAAVWRGSPTARPRSLAPQPLATPAVSSRVHWQCLQSEVLWLSWTSDSVRRAKAGWNAALVDEPRHARAHAGVALAEAVEALLGYGPAANAETLARRHAQRALELDGRAAAANAADAFVRLLFDQDPAGAAAAVRRADRAEPHEFAALMAGALVLEAQGRFDESVERLRQDRQDPEWAGILLLQGRAQQAQARWSEAIAAYERALALEPSLASARFGRAECLTAAGRGPEALRALRGPEAREEVPRLPAAPGLGTLTSAAPELRRAWRHACEAAGPTPRERARACVLSGDPEAAVAALRAGVEGGWPFVVFVPKDPAFAALRRYPGFAAVLPAAKPDSP